MGGEPETDGLLLSERPLATWGSSQEPGSFPSLPVTDFKDKERRGRDGNRIARKGYGRRKPGRKT